MGVSCALHVYLAVWACLVGYRDIAQRLRSLSRATGPFSGPPSVTDQCASRWFGVSSECEDTPSNSHGGARSPQEPEGHRRFIFWTTFAVARPRLLESSSSRPLPSSQAMAHAIAGVSVRLDGRRCSGGLA